MAEDAPERLAYTWREGTGFPSASADHVFAVLARQLDAQMCDVDAADSKIGVILGFTAAVAVAPLALVAGAGGDVKTESLVLFGVGVGLFLVSRAGAGQSPGAQRLVLRRPVGDVLGSGSRVPRDGTSSGGRRR